MTVLVALGLAATLIQTPAAASKAVIAGRVVEQGTGAPISGVQVVLMVQLAGPPNGPFPQPATATTDEQGRFAFSGVEPGRYRFNIQKTGFAPPFGPALGNMPPLFEVKGAERHAQSNSGCNVTG
jgi:hypothetical protein